MRLCRNPAINRGWRVAARERDPKSVALRHTSARLLQNEGSGVGNEILSVYDCRGSAHAGVPLKPRNATGRVSGDNADDILPRARTLERVRSAS